MASDIGVAPHAGAWIEMDHGISVFEKRKVAPHAGAWIEMVNSFIDEKTKLGRSPRGSVD